MDKAGGLSAIFVPYGIGYGRMAEMRGFVIRNIIQFYHERYNIDPSFFICGLIDRLSARSRSNLEDGLRQAAAKTKSK